MNPDPLETCPYDAVHRILRSRMQFHLTRCAKNYPDAKKKQCPFDTRHVINEVEFQYHLNHCSSRESVVHFKLQDPEAQAQVRLVPIHMDAAAKLDENWDEDVHVKSYVPLHHIQDRPVVVQSVGLSKAKRKTHRLAERIRFTQFADDSKKQNKQEHQNNQEKETAQPKDSPRQIKEGIDETADQNDQEYKPLRRPKRINRDNLDASATINNSLAESFNQSLVVKDSNENPSAIPQQDSSSNTIPNYAAALGKSTKKEEDVKVNVLRRPMRTNRDNLDASVNSLAENFNQSLGVKDLNHNVSATSQQDSSFNSIPSYAAAAVGTSSTKKEEDEKVNILNNSLLNKTSDSFVGLENLSKKMDDLTWKDETQKKKNEILNKQIEMMKNASKEKNSPSGKNSRIAANFGNNQ